MVDLSETITVLELMEMLAHATVTADMPVAMGNETTCHLVPVGRLRIETHEGVRILVINSVPDAPCLAGLSDDGRELPPEETVEL